MQVLTPLFTYKDLGGVWWGEKEWNLKPKLFGEVYKVWNLKLPGLEFHPNPLELEPPNYEGDQIWSLGGSAFNLKKIY